MTQTCILPAFTDQQAADAANALFGLAGPLKRLNGERDLNFLIQSRCGPVVFKIANRMENGAMLACQHAVFERMNTPGTNIRCPESIASVNGNIIESVHSATGIKHYCRAVTFIPGSLLSAVYPQTPELLESVGRCVADMDSVLQGFRHAGLERPLLWNMADAMATLDRFKPLLRDAAKVRRIERCQARFRSKVLPRSDGLRRGAVHNDINDNNVIVANTHPWAHSVAGIIDFGDMVYSWIAVDPAVAAAYVMLGSPKPLDAAAAVIRGYHRQFTLTELEISVLFELICTRLCLSVCICAYQQSLDPDNPYLRLSEQPAWAMLEKLEPVCADLAHYIFRDACGLEPVPASNRVAKWLGARSERFSSIVHSDLTRHPLLIMDTSVGSPDLPNPAAAFDPNTVARELFRAIEDAGCVAGIGRYDEYRLLYGSDDFIDPTGHRRTLHLGIDVFMPAGTAVHAPLCGSVYGVANHDAPLDYGGTLILQHVVDDAHGELRFYTLYGHLRPQLLASHEIGAPVTAGQKIAEMGDIHENGHWPPHLHLQIITDMLGLTDTFVGAGSHAHRNVWLSLCPDPNLILGIADSVMPPRENHPARLAAAISSSRAHCLGPSLSLSYRQPIHLARGGLQYLFDYTGRKYLDAVNNVAHVGHCHPVVVGAQRRQSGVLNTNTRYLYAIMQTYSERLLEKFPAPLNVCYFVNSGSEANDLALRMARNFTGRQDVVVLDHAYHGNLSSLIEISPYKHNSTGGAGPPPHVHSADMPDMYRSGYANHAAALTGCVESVRQAVRRADRPSGQAGVAAFICESISGCGGQVVLPDGYLAAVYALVRAAGGVCIADEVQVGFGRVGSHFWAFQTQHVVPDIVTLGKPMGNGHPLAAVITTREIADAFDNGMEYFSTFGGNPVSCAIGHAVLEVIEQEELQKNALDVGTRLRHRLDSMKEKYPLIGDVRGRGLFVGLELVNHPARLTPAAGQAGYIVERMKQEGVLLSTDGARHNVLKIKPPVCFNDDNVDQLVSTLDKILKEPFSQPVA